MNTRYIALKRSKVNHTDMRDQLGIDDTEYSIFYARSFDSIESAKLAVRHHNKRFPKNKVKISHILPVEWSVE